MALRRLAAAALLAACGGGGDGSTTGATADETGGGAASTGATGGGPTTGGASTTGESASASAGSTGGDPGLDPDAPPVVDGRWYRPGVSATWQYQLTGALVAQDVEIFDVDLFDTDAAAIAGLQAEGRRVLCYFSAGSGEDWRPDHGELDAAALGEPLDGWPGERWLDFRHASVQKVMIGRFGRAVEKGCDGVELDNVDGYTQASGFDLTATDQLAYDRWLANRAHERGLAVALKNDLEQVPALVDYFDLAVNEQCHEYEECDLLQPFVAAGKPALVVEYPGAQQDAEALAATLCPSALAAELRTIFLPLELDGSWRVACD